MEGGELNFGFFLIFFQYFQRAELTCRDSGRGAQQGQTTRNRAANQSHCRKLTRILHCDHSAWSSPADPLAAAEDFYRWFVATCFASRLPHASVIKKNVAGLVEVEVGRAKFSNACLI